MRSQGRPKSRATHLRAQREGGDHARSIRRPQPLSVMLVGPLPPPSGGMANQCEQLVRLLHGEGVGVQLVCTNLPYWPSWSGRLPVLRAGFTCCRIFGGCGARRGACR